MTGIFVILQHYQIKSLLFIIIIIYYIIIINNYLLLLTIIQMRQKWEGRGVEDRHLEDSYPFYPMVTSQQQQF
jgi:hypothetical protein